MKAYSKRDAFRIEAIIDELCNNAIEHGNADLSTPIEVVCKIYRYQLELSIINQSSGSTQEQSELDEFKKRIQGEVPFNLNERRGRGIELVKMLCNEFKVATRDGQTIVKIIKKKEV
jgi:anti-sigma regulatory factor (Ser/Thr protein kinase)